MSKIKTWNERCEEHPDHQTGMVSNSMIQARMQEEIDELRAALAEPVHPAIPLENSREAADAIEATLAEYGHPTNPVNAARAGWRAARLYTAPPQRPVEPVQEPVEPVAYIHRQGRHWEVSERPLADDEKARGWTEEPLYTSPPQRPAEPVQEPVQEPFALPCPTPKACKAHCCSGHCIPRSKA